MGTADKQKKNKELATLQARLTASVGLARSVVSAWIPSDYVSDEETTPKPETKREQDEDPEGIVTGRPPRLGIGAKFLSHAQATAVGSADLAPETGPEAKLRRSLNIGRKAGLNHMGHKKKADLRRQESESESDEECRTGITKTEQPIHPDEHLKKKTKRIHEAHGPPTVGSKKHGQFLVKSVPTKSTSTQEATSTPALAETAISISQSGIGGLSAPSADTDSSEEESTPKISCKAPIPGDFLSQYLNERDGKKKKRKKKKKKQKAQQTEGEVENS